MVTKNYRRYVLGVFLLFTTAKGYGMKDSVFRSYDIRGRVGTELVIEDVYDVVRSILAYCVESKGKDVLTVAVGMDGRTHSPAIKEQVCRAILDSGKDVIFVGVCPSPALYFACHTLPVQLGLMITASHNPGTDNGIKIKLHHESVWGDQLQEIKQWWKEKRVVTSTQPGSYSEQEIIPTYVDWFASNFPHLIGMKLSALIDCGNGAAGTVLPQLIKKMQWQNVDLLYPEVDGAFPNHEADPVQEANMQDLKKHLLAGNYDLGAGLDGDCDRMAPMTRDGYLVPGDKLLAVFSKLILHDNPGSAIVFDIKSSGGLGELIARWGGKPIMSPTGHAFVKQNMKHNHAVLGGELSCHFFFEDRYFGYDDGFYALMRLFEVMVVDRISLEDLIAEFPVKYSSPEYRVPCAEADKEMIVENVRKFFASRSDVALVTIDGVKATMSYGWGIVRPSNTQPMLSMRFEANSPEDLERIKGEFIAALQGHIDPVHLR